MSRFHDQTTAWFNRGEDEEVLAGTPGAEEPPRRSRHVLAVSGVAIAAAVFALCVALRPSRAAMQKNSPAGVTEPALPLAQIAAPAAPTMVATSQPIAAPASVPAAAQTSAPTVAAPPPKATPTPASPTVRKAGRPRKRGTKHIAAPQKDE